MVEGGHRPNHQGLHQPLYIQLARNTAINDEICGLLEAGDREGAAALLREYLARAEAQLLSILAGP